MSLNNNKKTILVLNTVYSLFFTIILLISVFSLYESIFINPGKEVIYFIFLLCFFISLVLNSVSISKDNDEEVVNDVSSWYISILSLIYLKFVYYTIIPIVIENKGEPRY